MSKTFFADQLDTAATWWRIHRRDGVTLGFATHDRDLWFDGVMHRAAPGMLPSAIRRTSGFEDDPSDVAGALSHDAIHADDLVRGRYDAALIESGVVDWQTSESVLLYRGSLGAISREEGSFRAELVSDKARLAQDRIPLTGPSCRAQFCGPGCDLNPQFHQRRALVTEIDPAAHSLKLNLTDAVPYRFGRLRWIDGPLTGIAHSIVDAQENTVTLADPLLPEVQPGQPMALATTSAMALPVQAAASPRAVNPQ